MRSLLSLFVTVVVVLRRLGGVLVGVFALVVALLFGLQFAHPQSWDSAWPVVMLHRFGDPVLAKVGSWFFMVQEGEPPVWPADELRYFPVVIVIGLIAVWVGVDKLLAAAIRSGRTAARRAKREETEPGSPTARPPAAGPAVAATVAHPYATPPPGTPLPPGASYPPPAYNPYQTPPPAGWPYTPPAGTPGLDPRYTPPPGGWPATVVDPVASGVPGVGPPAGAAGAPATADDGTLLYRPKDTLSVGSTVGRYEILDELGRGAMGVVYKANDPSIGRVVAVKKILVGLLAPDEADEYRERFRREAQAAGKLNHPGIIGVYDVLESGEQSCMVMEFVEGTTLEELMATERLSLGRTLDVMTQVADALGYAHRHNVVHRDMKPANILIGEGLTVKIADFGIAKMVGTKLTRTGQIMGTPAFMAPEQFQGESADARSDVFSLGSILYWLTTGEHPFPGDSITAIGYKVVQTNPVPARQLNPALPEEIDQIVARCLQKNRDRRYPTAAELKDDLEAFRQGRPLSIEGEATADS